jgi:hypothetical protein
MDYDEKSDAQSILACAFAVVTATPTPVSIDCLDFGALTFEMFAGAGGITFTGTNRIDFKVEDSDDGTNWSVVDDDFLILDPGAAAPGGTGIVRSITSAHAAADTTIPTVGYVGKAEYARCTPVFGGTHSVGTLVGVVARKGYAYHKPVGASAIEV